MSSIGPSIPHPLRPPTQLQKWAARLEDDALNPMAGASSGLIAGIIACPLDVIRTKLQVQGAAIAAARRSGGMDALPPDHQTTKGRLIRSTLVIWRDDGFKGFYRGLGPIVCGYFPSWAITFGVYGKVRQELDQRLGTTRPTVNNILASIPAGLLSTLATHPIWVVKVRLQTQESAPGRGGGMPYHYRSSFDCARRLYANGGVPQLYAGVAVALLGVSHLAIQFPLYEALRRRFTGGQMGQVSGESRARHQLGILAASSLSKIIATSATYPHEVIRTRMQTAEKAPRGARNPLDPSLPVVQLRAGAGPRYVSIMKTVRTILIEEGWRGLYCGMGTGMIRTVPASAVTFFSYEYILEWMKIRRDGAREATGSGT